MKHILLFFLLSFISYGQDTIIDMGIYKSHFNKILKEPSFVEYILYKGGGNCKRTDNWINDTKLSMPTTQFNKSGYDKGHLANAEDFAYSCSLQSKTFRYYNCLPQTPNLNRGVWKKWEKIIRDESQKDSLLIITGGIWLTKTTCNGMYIPDECWKVVYSLRAQVVIHVLLFTNRTKNSTCKEIHITELEKKLGKKIELSF